MLTATSASVRAQEAQNDSRQATLGTFTPFVTLAVRGAFGTPDEAIGLYVYWSALRDEGGKRGFAARRISMGSTGEAGIDWATSFACSGLEGVITELEAVPMPLVDVPTVGRDDHQGPPADGVTYTLWSRYPTWSDGFGYSIEISSNVNSPLAAWSQKLRTVMVSCWTSQTPAIAGEGVE